MRKFIILQVSGEQFVADLNDREVALASQRYLPEQHNALAGQRVVPGRSFWAKSPKAASAATRLPFLHWDGQVVFYGQAR